MNHAGGSEQLALALPEDRPLRMHRRALGPGALALHGFALEREAELLRDVARVVAEAPFRSMRTPGGRTISAQLTSCGTLGWISDERGYRYGARDPARDRPWPAMPASLLALARDAAAQAGFRGFVPDACLMNRYAPGARMSLHQDDTERDLRSPIVSVSLGLPAIFLFGGIDARQRPARILVRHGDVLVWGGPSRLCHHGVLPVPDGIHASLGRCRVNLTFRKAG